MLPCDLAGSGEAVVLVHAGVADRRMWRDSVAFLAEHGYRAVAPDLPGFGDAPVEAGPQAPWDDVLATMQALELERATLVGDSFGAAVALRVAIRAPAAVAALMLVSPPPIDLDPSPRLAAIWEAEESALERGDVDAAVDTIVKGWTLPDAPASLRDRVAEMQRRAYELQLAAGPVAQDAPDPADANGAVEAIRVPVLCAAGEHDLPDFIDAGRALAARIPGARYTGIEGAGHLAPLEVPATFHALLLDFLRR